MTHYNKEALLIGRKSTYQWLFDTQRFVSSLAITEKIPPKVSMDPNGNWIAVGGVVVDLARFRKGMQTLDDRLTESYRKIVRGPEKFSRLPDNGIIPDDLPNDERGYSFAAGGNYVRGEDRDVFLKTLLQRRHMVRVLENGEASIDFPAARQALREMDEFICLLMFAMQCTFGAHFRTTQLAQTRIRNGDRRRNLYMIGTLLALFTIYVKSGNLTGRDTLIPHFCPTFIQSWIQEVLLGGFRATQVALAGWLYGPKQAQNYRE